MKTKKYSIKTDNFRYVLSLIQGIDLAFISMPTIKFTYSHNQKDVIVVDTNYSDIIDNLKDSYSHLNLKITEIV